jgi:hypothetical protein
MRWFHYTVQEFEESSNPPNSSYVLMERQIFSDSWTPNHFSIAAESAHLCGFQNKQFDLCYSKQHLSKIIEEVPEVLKEDSTST